MSRPKGSVNKIKEVEVPKVETKPDVRPIIKSEFDPSLPESKQRHLR